MTEHLSASAVTALVDGELAGIQWSEVKEHLDRCSSCTSQALNQALLKSASRGSGLRYTPPGGLEARLRARLRAEAGEGEERGNRRASVSTVREHSRGGRGLRATWAAGWAVAAALVAFLGGWQAGQRQEGAGDVDAAARTALVSEVADLHIATLAGTLPPEVLSSDRHTVKPWFQGRIPFAFSLPETLPPDTTLEGANLSYLHNRPAAQLLFRIGAHRASVFLQAEGGCEGSASLPAQRAGFQIIAFESGAVCGVAISDVDRTRLIPLVAGLERAQGGTRN